MNKQQVARAIDAAILRGLRLRRPDGSLVRSGRELLAIQPEFDPERGVYFFPVVAEAEAGPESKVENN
jgi:hypothetical protein